MRTLILMRHAKSDWSSPQQADHERPLNARGRRAALAMADHLIKQAIQVDVILVSSAVRAQQTIELMRGAWGQAAVLWTVPSLYLASPQEIARHIHGLHDSWSRAMVVGHNPGISQLASQVGRREVELPTAAIALFRSDGETWANSLNSDGWEFEAIWKPRDLEAS